MKLWILRPRETTEGDNPWSPWYDKVFGFVVRAETARAARKIANENAGDENRGCFLGEKTSKTKQPWLDAKYSKCTRLGDDGKQGLVMRDSASA